MKRFNTLGVMIAAAALFFTIPAMAQKVEKEIKKVFDHKSSMVLEVDSKFGEVEIMNREDGKVEVIANIWVESNRTDDAKELLAQMDAQIELVDNRIIVKSVLPEKINNRRDTKFRIDFQVFTPANTDLVLSSKYGSAFVDNIAGQVTISIAYGNFSARNLSRINTKPLSSLNLAYSNGNIESAGWLKLDLAYSKLSVDEGQALVVISKYSALSVDKTSSLVMDSKYDTYSIGDLNNFLGNLKYGNLKIDQLYKKFEIESQYTAVKLEEVGQDFEKIKINNERGAYKIGINERSSFTLNGEAIRGDIAVYGMENINTRSENANKYVDGRYGNNPSSTLEIMVKEGSVKIELDE